MMVGWFLGCDGWGTPPRQSQVLVKIDTSIEYSTRRHFNG